MSDKLVHAIKMIDGSLMVSAKLMEQLKDASEEATTSLGSFAGINVIVSPHLPYKEKVPTAREWFSRNGGIENKQTRELVMLLDSKTLSGTGYGFKILKRGRIILTQLPYAKDFRRTVRHSKEVHRLRNLTVVGESTTAAYIDSNGVARSAFQDNKTVLLYSDGSTRVKNG